MEHRSTASQIRTKKVLMSRQANRIRGYSVVELLVVIAISATMMAVASPVIWNTLSSMSLNSAVQSASGAISGTRYQALRYGYPFRVTFSTTIPISYQVLSEPTAITGNATAFSNVGAAVPLTGTGGVALNANTTIQFNPSGTAQLIAGGTGFSLDGQTFTIAYAGKTTTISVSSVGYVSTTTQ